MYIREGESRTHRKDNITGAGKNISVQPEDLADKTLDPVTPDRRADLTRHTDPQTADRLIPVQIYQQKIAAVQPYAFPVDPVELPCFSETAGTRQSEPLHEIRRKDVSAPWPAAV